MAAGLRKPINVFSLHLIYSGVLPVSSSPFSSLSLLVVTKIRGGIAGFSPPSPLRALHFDREKISVLSSLVDSRRIVLTHAM